ncbi:MAG: FliM/FliN family flagellar motor switch protein [Planctomycetota bacterium]|jgi:flagellar motor switch protein FliN/FliY
MTDSEQVKTEQTEEQTSDKVQAQTVEFGEATDAGTDSGENLNILMDVQMPITVVIGKAEVPFKRLLQLGPNSVLELDRLVGQPADLFVQDVRLATGDIVVVNDNYGIRIREVVGSESVRDMDAAKEAFSV